MVEENPPAPLPHKMNRVVAVPTTRSSLPSPLKSAASIQVGFVPPQPDITSEGNRGLLTAGNLEVLQVIAAGFAVAVAVDASTREVGNRVADRQAVGALRRAGKVSVAVVPL